jgi:hypothetical protein
VFIAGNQAQRHAAISWEGVALGINSNNGGAFTFNTTNLPSDCVGRLNIGTEERDVVIDTCTPAPITITVIEAGVPKTGQTAVFATGDDVDLKKGVSLPNPRFTDNGNGTITDNLTGLIWLKNASCQPVITITWQQALTFVAGINAGTNNCSDTSRELQSLVDYGHNDPSLPSGHPFTGFHGAVYWSSTTNNSNPGVSYGVEFGNGDRAGTVPNLLKTDTAFFDHLYVIAVRGGS